MQIKLISLDLESFRGLRSFSIQPDGENAAIIGANGTGKSTLATAFLWLLTGKDAQGRDNYNIFPLDADGRRVSGCSPAVRATLTVDGKELTLQRSMTERWTKRRGAAETEYAGDETRFVVNEVPVSATEYSKRIAELVPEKLLPLLTSAAWFSEQTKDYKERRKLLMEQFGEITPEDVFGAHPELHPLRDALGNHTVDDYSRICADRRKRCKDALATIPARIDENRKQLPDRPADYSAIKAQRGAVNVELGKLRYELEHTNAASEGENLKKELAQVQEQLAIIPQKQKAIEQAVNAEWYAERSRAKITAINTKSDTEFALKAARRELTAVQRSLQEEETRRDALRVEWMSVNSCEANIMEVCPTCGQPIPPERIQESLAQYNASKSEKLAEIAEKGAAAAAKIETLTARKDELQSEVYRLESQLEQDSAELARLESSMPPAAESPLLKELETQQRQLREKESSLLSSIGNLEQHAQNTSAGLRERITELQNQSDALSAQLAAADRETEIAKRIEQLEKEKLETMQTLENAEKGLSMCQDFTREMVTMLTERVNQHFPTVRWKLFEEQKNGGLREVCEATVDGVPYGALNTAGKMQANVEIVAAFADATGVSLPLFLDNRESVTNLDISKEMQIINLKVMPGAKLSEE